MKRYLILLIVFAMATPCFAAETNLRGGVKIDTADKTVYWRHDATGRLSSYYGIPILLPIQTWSLTNAAISTSTDPKLAWFGAGRNASGAIIWPNGGPFLNAQITKAGIYKDFNFAALNQFRVPSDYKSDKTARFRLLVQHMAWHNPTTHQNIKVDYEYSASTDGVASDTSLTAGKRVALAPNHYPQWVTLTCPDTFTAGGWGTLRVYRSWEGYPGGHLRLLDAVMLYNIEG